MGRMKREGLKLFNDDNDDETTAANISKIEVDEEFARRYEHNKEREDLHRFQELQKKGLIDDDVSDSESSSTDDDDDDYDGNNEVANLSKKEDVEFFKNLIKVRNRDPSIYQNVSLFDRDSSDANGEREEEGDMTRNINKKNKKKKSMYLKDVVAQHLMEEGPEFDENNEPKNKKAYKTYDEEQLELKNALLDAIHDVEEQEDGDGYLLKVKEKNNNENIADGDNAEFEKKLREYFGQEELDENKLFLKEFFLNKMWVDKGCNDGKAVFEDDDLSDLLRDGEEIEKQEEYEENYYKFRYQENTGDRIMGHSRKVEGSVRKKPNARKSQRQRKEESMKIAEIERKEELKHLKNVKKKEMKEKMKKVLDAAGIEDDNDCLLDLDNLEAEFDPEEYDKMMKKAFNDNYYEAEDVDPHFGHDSDEDAEIGKPDFDKEDEFLGLPKGWDVLDSSDGFLAARKRVLEQKSKNDVEEDNDREEEEEEEGEEEDHGEEERSEESKRKRKRKMSLVKKAKEEMLEEYYKLDYEGTIGDLKTRFKYAKVDPNRYGLKTYEILMSDDKDLNQYVSVKKLAPYREKEWKVPDNQRYRYKTMLKERLRGKGKDEKTGKKNQKIEESNVDLTGLSRNAKRRRCKAELSLSRGRLWAYGKIPSGAKSKGKH